MIPNSGLKELVEENIGFRLLYKSQENYTDINIDTESSKTLNFTECPQMSSVDNATHSDDRLVEVWFSLEGLTLKGDISSFEN